MSSHKLPPLAEIAEKGSFQQPFNAWRNVALFYALSYTAAMPQRPLTMTDPEYLRVEDVAARLKVNVQTVRKWLRTGELKGHQPGGKNWYVLPEDLRRFVTRRSAADGR